jgi:hypothetical protein
MSRGNSLLKGSRFSRSHSTLIDEAAFLVREAKKIPHISKIIISEIVPIRVGVRRLKITPVPAGLKLMVRGVGARQILFIYTKQQELAAKVFELLFEKKFQD